MSMDLNAAQLVICCICWLLSSLSRTLSISIYWDINKLLGRSGSNFSNRLSLAPKIKLCISNWIDCTRFTLMIGLKLEIRLKSKHATVTIAIKVIWSTSSFTSNYNFLDLIKPVQTFQTVEQSPLLFPRLVRASACHTRPLGNLRRYQLRKIWRFGFSSGYIP